jgi:copper transport protein
VRTVPRANVVLNRPPPVVQLTYTRRSSRASRVSVTNAAGSQQTAGSPRRSAADPKTLVVPLKRVGEGWYLVYWRVISVDGHPVRGAFDVRRRAEPGPAAAVRHPVDLRDGGDAAADRGRSIVFVAIMARSGSSCCGSRSARPVVRRVPGRGCAPSRSPSGSRRSSLSSQFPSTS